MAKRLARTLAVARRVRLDNPPRRPPVVAFDPEDNLFLLAGPVKMHHRVRAAMSAPALAHRSPEFGAVNERIFDHCRTLLDTKHVAILAGSGTAGMDAAVSNLVHWGDRAIGLDGGKFGERMADLAAHYAGPEAVRITAPWGKAFDLDAIEAALEEGASAVCFTLNDTSTATMNDGRAIAHLCRKHDALSIADTITATGAVPTPMDDWNLDVAIFGSQKCIGGPAGLAFVGVSERAYERLDSPSYYLDLKKHIDRAEKDNQTPFTAAVPLHLACVEALDQLMAEGLEARFARTKQMAAGCRAAVEATGLELAADADVRSDTVTAVRYPDGITDRDIRGRLKEELGVVVAGAQADWKGKVFRIGHLGQASWAELAAGWAALEVAFKRAGHPLPAGAGVAALVDAVA